MFFNFTIALNTKGRSVFRGFSALSAALSLGALTTSAAFAQIYATGFEPSPASPAWTTGQFAGTGGQNSWGDSDSSSPAGHGSTSYANAAFNVVANNYSLTGPGGTESIPAFSGSQMLDSATTYVATGAGASSTTTYTNVAYTQASLGLKSAWTASGKSTLETSFDIYIPSVDSTLQGANGIIFYGGALDITNLGSVSFANSASGALQVSVNPATGLTTTDGSGLFPNVLKRDNWINVTTYLNYNNGDLTVNVTNGTHSLTIDKQNAFDTSATWFSSEFIDASNSADASLSFPNANAFFDNYTVQATAPAPNALPIFATGLIAVAPWIRRCRRNRANR